jgi:hypothetical protein
VSRQSQCYRTQPPGFDSHREETSTTSHSRALPAAGPAAAGPGRAWLTARPAAKAGTESLVTALTTDLPATARAIRDPGGIEPFLTTLPPA